MILLRFFLALLKFVQSAALKDYPEDRMFCYSALVIALESHCPDMFCYEEDDVHRVATTMRIRGRYLGLGFQRLLTISKEAYSKYLERIRVKVLSRKNVRIFVEKLPAAPNYVREYLTTTSEVDVFHYKPVARQLCSLVISQVVIDHVTLEYHRNALAALTIFASIHRDYHGYARFPNISEPLSLRQLEEFIGENFVSFDYGATYPDIVMCLSYLQYLKYMALLEANLDLVTDISGLFHKAVVALKHINVTTVNELYYMTPIGQIIVSILPQAIEGPKSIPICILSVGNGICIHISVLNVEYPENPDYVSALLKHLLGQI